MGDYVGGVLGGDVGWVGDVSGEGVDAFEVGDEAVDFCHADSGCGVADLTVEVGGLDDVVVDYADCPDACSGDILSCWTTETSGPDDEDPGVYKTELT